MIGWTIAGLITGLIAGLAVSFVAGLSFWWAVLAVTVFVILGGIGGLLTAAVLIARQGGR